MSDLNSLLPKLKNKLLEVGVGDEYEELVLTDHNKKINGVIYGVLKDIVEDFMVLDCYAIKDGKLHNGNIVYINTWNVKYFTEANASGSLNDVLLSSAHSRRMKVLLGLTDE